MRVVDDQVLFAVDADYPKDDGTVDVYVDDAYEDAPAEDTKHGLQGLCATKELYTDKEADEGESFMTGYVPIRNSAGEVVGVLGVDFDVSTVKQKQDFLGSLIYSVLGAAIIIASLVALYFGGTLIRELSKRTKVARELLAGNLNVTLLTIGSRGRSRS